MDNKKSDEPKAGEKRVLPANSEKVEKKKKSPNNSNKTAVTKANKQSPKSPKSDAVVKKTDAKKSTGKGVKRVSQETKLDEKVSSML